jgi:PKD domain-containing protein
VTAYPVGALAAAVGVLALIVAAPARAEAGRVAGIVRDVPTGTQVAAGAGFDPQIASKHPRMPYGGGRVLHSNRSHVVFWEPAGSGLAFEPGYESLVESFLMDVAADSRKTTNVYALSGQYADASGLAAYDSTYGGAVVDTDPLPASGCTEPAMTGPGWVVCMTDFQLETELEHVIVQNNLPTTRRDIYFVVTPNGLGSCTDAGSSSCALGGSLGGYCGYHSETESGILYAVIPYNGVPGHCQSNNPRPNSNPADPTISTISHEHNETVTDPDGNAWVDAHGNEEADLCLTNFGPSLSAVGGDQKTAWNESIHGGHFFLQEEWSNGDNACEPRAKPDMVSFDSTGVPGRGAAMAFTAHGTDPQGQLVRFEWFFGDGQAGFGRRVSHSFRTPGTYRVRLRTTDSWGNWAYARGTVSVRAR